MSRFVTEPYEKALTDAELEQTRPLTADALLNRLYLTLAPPAQQRAGVARWLADNEPHPMLLEQLHELGLVSEPGTSSHAA